jgi:tRNA(adenine34) deaminase
MNLALQQARQAFSCGEIPVGALLVDHRSQTIIFSGHNQVEATKDPTAHAEILAIQRASQHFQTAILSFCDLYVTLEPCPMCAQAISFARLRRVIFGAFNPKGGGIDHGPQIFNPAFGNWQPEIVGGIQATECQDLLSTFFQQLRKSHF